MHINPESCRGNKKYAKCTLTQSHTEVTKSMQNVKMHIDQGNADIIDTIQISKVQELTKLKRYPIVNTVACELNLVKIIKSVD